MFIYGDFTHKNTYETLYATNNLLTNVISRIVYCKNNNVALSGYVISFLPQNPLKHLLYEAFIVKTGFLGAGSLTFPARENNIIARKIQM